MKKLSLIFILIFSIIVSTVPAMAFTSPADSGFANLAAGLTVSVYKKGAYNTSNKLTDDADWVSLTMQQGSKLTDGKKSMVSAKSADYIKDFRDKRYAQLAFVIDFGESKEFSNVILYDKRAAAYSSYKVLVSDNASEWTEAKSDTSSWEIIQDKWIDDTTSTNFYTDGVLSVSFTKQTKRYVRVELSGYNTSLYSRLGVKDESTGIWSEGSGTRTWYGCIDEIEVYNTPATQEPDPTPDIEPEPVKINLALNCNVTAYKLSGVTETDVATSEAYKTAMKRLTNGNQTDGMFSPMQNINVPNNNMSHVIDLGSLQKFSEIVVYDNRAGGYEKCIVQVSNDNQNWKNVASLKLEWEKLGGNGKPSKHPVKTTIRFSEQEAQYVKYIFIQGFSKKVADMDGALVAEGEPGWAAVPGENGAVEIPAARFPYAPAEIEVYNNPEPYEEPEQKRYENTSCFPSQNFARNCSVSTGSNAEASSKITDGKIAMSGSVWESTNSQSDWLMVDLGRVQLVDTIKVTERFNRIKNYMVEYSVDSENWFELARSMSESVNEPNVNKNIVHTISTYPVAARYIRFNILSGYGEAFNIEEIQCYYTADMTQINLANSEDNGSVAAHNNLVMSNDSRRHDALLPSSEYYASMNWIGAKADNEHTAWYAVNLSEEQQFNRIQVIPGEDLITKYEIYATSNDAVWNDIVNLTTSVTVTDDILNSMDLIKTTEVDYEYDYFQWDKTEFVNETKASRKFVYVDDFEPVTAKYILFIARGERQQKKMHHIWSFEVYNTSDKFSFYIPSGAESVFDASDYEDGNLVTNATVSTNAEYAGDKVGQDYSVLKDGERFKGENKFYIADNTKVDFDFGGVKPVDKLVIYEFGKKLKKFSVYVSDNKTDWTKVKTFNNTVFDQSNVPAYREYDFDMSFGRYLRIEFENCENGAAAVSEIEAYCSDSTAELAMLLDYPMLTDEPINHITADLLDLPSSVSDGSNTVNINWSSNSDAINPENGAVTRLEEDTTVVLTADMDIAEGIEKKFHFVVKGTRLDDKVLVHETSNADFEAADGFSQYIFKPQNGFKLTDGIVTEFDTKAVGTAKIDFGCEEYQIGVEADKVILKNGSGEAIKETSVSTANLKFKVLLYDGMFSLYIDKGDGKGLRTFAADIAVDGETEFEKVSVTDALLSGNIKVFILTCCIFNTVSSQLELKRFTDEKNYAITAKLNLPSEVYGAALTYTASTDVVNAVSGEITGKGECTLTCMVSYNGENEKQSFDLIARNLFAGATANTDASPVELTTIQSTTDGDGSTYFKTKLQSFSITVELSDTKTISDLLIKQSGEGRIIGCDVYTSVDGSAYNMAAADVNTIQNDIISIALTDAKYVKLVVKECSGAVQINEIAALYKPSAAKKMNADLKCITIPENSSGSFVLPAVGTYGSVISYSSDKSYITFSQEDGSYKISVTAPQNDEYAYITVQLSCDGQSMSKQYKVLINGSGSIRDNVPGGETSPGGGLTLGGGGGGGGGVSDKNNDKDKTDETPDKDMDNTEATPNTNPIDTLYAETKNHWAEEEINYLISNGIVKGSGNSGLKLESTITRAEFLALVARGMGIEEMAADNSFADVNVDDWHSGIIRACTELGIVKGSGENFYPDNRITREEMAVILAYFCKTAETAYDFADKNDISDWAVDAVAAASANGLIKGYEDGSFMPADFLKRDEAMAVVYRLIKMKESE